MSCMDDLNDIQRLYMKNMLNIQVQKSHPKHNKPHRQLEPTHSLIGSDLLSMSSCCNF